MANEKPYPPFITARSPSYERASREHRHPTRSREAQAVAVLSLLSEAEDQADQVCKCVADLLADPSLAAKARELATTHQAYRSVLGELIAAAGGSPPRRDEGSAPLAHGALSVARGLTDSSTLQRLSVLHDELAALYASAAEAPELDDAQRAAVLGLMALVGAARDSTAHRG